MSIATVDLTPSPLELMRQRAAQRPDYLDLSSSNPTLHGFIFPPDLLRAAADEYWYARRYQPESKGSLRAREAIAQYYAQRTPSLHIPPDHIFITASTSEAYSLLFSLLTEPSDNVLAPVPSYPLFAHLAEIHHIALKPYVIASPFMVKQSPIDSGEIASQTALAMTSEGIASQTALAMTSNQWYLDTTQFTAQADDRTRAILLISPHNPTGHVIAEKFQIPTSNLQSSISNVQLPLIADEVFCEFPFAASQAPPIGALFPEATVFHLNGLSKMFALPDLKLSWIALSGPRADKYVERLELLNDTFLSANSLTQFMLPTLFARGMEFVATMRARIQHNLREAIAALQPIPPVRVAPPMGGMYLFPEMLECEDEDKLLERMLQVGLFAHPGYFYDEERGCHVMISGLLETPRLLEGIERLGRALLTK
jgi:aspartate/methionine/tyrosine aminotransferase